jgi:hypothetical protein
LGCGVVSGVMRKGGHGGTSLWLAGGGVEGGSCETTRTSTRWGCIRHKIQYRVEVRG